MALAKQEIDLAVEKALSSLDEVVGETPQGPVALKSYFDTVGVDNIKGTGIKKRIVRKVLAPSSALTKKLMQGYLEQRTRVDATIQDTLWLQQREITQMRNEFREVIQKDAYETQKLVDGFKKEILAELVDLKPTRGPKIEAKIINKAKVDKVKKINIGSGRDIRDDYINVDHRQIDGVDVIADVRSLPFEKGSLDEIYASHVVEHFTEKDAKEILAYWFTLLKKGGVIRIIVPNIDVMAREYAKGNLTWGAFHSVILGAQDYASDHHFNQFSLDSMEDLVRAAAPVAIFEIVEGARPNGESIEMEVTVGK